MHLSILLQISNYDVYIKIKKLINFDHYNLIMIHINTELINDKQINIIKKEFKQAKFTFGKNIGMDIYPFFCQIKYIIDNNINTDYILKIHTKSNDEWRNDLILPLINHKEITSLIQNNNIGMIASKKYTKLLDHYNTPIILHFLKKWNIENKYIDEIDWDKKYNNLYDLNFLDTKFYITYPYNKIMYDNNLLEDKDKLNSYAIFHWLNIGYKVFRLIHNPNLITKKINNHYTFCAGTIFWIDAKIIIDFFKKNIDFKFWENKFEKGYIKNELPTYTHSWERLFAIMIFYNNKILHTL